VQLQALGAAPALTRHASRCRAKTPWNRVLVSRATGTTLSYPRPPLPTGLVLRPALDVAHRVEAQLPRVHTAQMRLHTCRWKWRRLMPSAVAASRRVSSILGTVLAVRARVCPPTLIVNLPPA
jgi:hypothetical protein